MSSNLQKASLISTAATLLITLIAAASSSAAAERNAPAAPPAQISQTIPGQTQTSEVPVLDQLETQPLPTALEGSAPPAPNQPAPANQPVAPTVISAASLAELVAVQPVPDEISPEMKCLASAIYYEARSESLSGQLAVGRVIVNRTRSGRFPSSYCGVVYQPSQFSFVHGAGMRAGLNARMWRNAIAVAQIAHTGSWQSEAEGALYFHAARVSPAWHLRRIAQIDNHIFYR